MESMGMKPLFGNIYKDKVCLVTGHTGFKGSWLAFWLTTLGAKVIGFSLQPPTRPNHFELLNTDYISIIGDIRNKVAIDNAVIKNQPDIVFHLAAQPLVRRSYQDPVETFETNVLGVLNVFEACKKAQCVKAIINITSDKCYENKEWIWGYRETDPMGGHDPYSASKGCSEILTSSYRRSFFNPEYYGSRHNTLLASVRAGNVIGGGDWAEDRIVPDIIRAASQKACVSIRNPKAVRPWQHVLEPLSGYLTLGWKLLEGQKEYAAEWNFGPDSKSNSSVKELVKLAQTYWPVINYSEAHEAQAVHEANLLMLDCTKAAKILHWQPVWDFQQTIQKTIVWYKEYYDSHVVNSEKDLQAFINDAREKGISWSL